MTAPLEYAHTAKPSPGPHAYVVYMKDGHTVTKHFALIGKELPCLARLEDVYRAIMTDAERETVRTDPGKPSHRQSRVF